MLKNEPGTLIKSWYLLGILVWRTQRTLTLEEQAFQIKKEILVNIQKIYDQNEKVLEQSANKEKELNQKIEKVLEQKEDIKKEVLTEINQGIETVLNPNKMSQNAR